MTSTSSAHMLNEGCSLFDEIARTPARTMDGFVLKARILVHENDSAGRDEAAIERAAERTARRRLNNSFRSLYNVSFVAPKNKSLISCAQIVFEYNLA